MMKYVRTLYDWTLHFAGHRHAKVALFGIAFAESSFFPIPPDTLLLPMCLARRQDALKLALICTLGSLLGGVLGYVIGFMFADTILPWLATTLHIEKALLAFEAMLQKNAFWVVLASGFTLIPFKIVTISAGVMKVSFPAFFSAASITRSVRFFMEGWLIWKYGDPVRGVIEAHMGKILAGLTLFVIIIAVVLRYVAT